MIVSLNSYVISESINTSTLFIGQVHLCTETNRPSEVMEAAFLHRTQINQCHDEWKVTIHGHTTFTREDPHRSKFNENISWSLIFIPHSLATYTPTSGHTNGLFYTYIVSLTFNLQMILPPSLAQCIPTPCYTNEFFYT